jgi:hypothetical protein
MESSICLSDNLDVFDRFMHVDGESFEDQLEILKAARQLFTQHLIGAVAIEHSLDLDVKNDALDACS